MADETNQDEKRKAFEATPWKKDDKGAPVNPAADPDCLTCDGFGVTERRSVVGERFEGFENCPHCWVKQMTIEELEAMGARLKE
jgi:hypothetical protein